MHKITIKKDSILLVGIFLLMNSILTFLSSKYNFIGKPMFYMGGIIVLIYVVTRPYRVFNSKLFMWYSLFMLYTLASVLWSIDPTDSLEKWLYLVVFHLIAICSIAVYGNSSDNLQTLMKLYVFASVILCIVIILDGPLGSNNLRYGWSTTGEQSNTPAMNLASSFAFAFYFVRKSNTKKLKVLYSVCLALFFVTIFLTGSRKIFIYILGFITLYALHESKDIKKTVMYICSIIVGLLIASYVLINNEFMYNLVGNKIFTDLSEETSAVLRSALKIQAWEYFKSSPLLGHGFYSFDKVSFNGLYAHNNYLEILTGLGIIGLLLYYGFLLSTLLSLWKRKKDEMCFLFFSMLLMSFVIEYWQVNYVQKGVYFIYAMAFCEQRIVWSEKSIIYHQGGVISDLLDKIVLDFWRCGQGYIVYTINYVRINIEQLYKKKVEIYLSLPNLPQGDLAVVQGV